MSMAEKQYKNYDERFLKEEASEPIVIEAVFDSKDTVLLISEWPDGTPIQTVEDLYSVFKSRAAIAFTREVGGRPTELVVNPIFFQKYTNNGQLVAMMAIDIGDIGLVTTEEIYNIITPN